MTTHIMADVESLGTRVGSVVLSAALVRFQDEAHTTLNIDWADQVKLGLETDDNTVRWWQERDRSVYDAALANPVPLVPALQHLTAWIQWAAPDPNDFFIWCHGATFDGPLLEAVYRAAGLPCPWQYWQVRCTRTLYDLAGVNPKDYAVPPPHVAINDAIGQTRAAVAALRVLAGVRGVVA